MPSPSDSLSHSRPHSPLACSPAGRSTPLPGAVSEAQCLSPLPNFIIGAFALGVATVLAAVYVVLGRFHRVSFIRRERVVLPEIARYASVLEGMEELEAELHSEVVSDQLRKQVGAALHAQQATWLDLYKRRVLRRCKLLLFVLVAAGTVFLGTIFFLAVLLSTALFYTLVLWKSLRGMSFGISIDYQDIVSELLEAIFSRLPPWIVTVLRALTLPMVAFLRALSTIRLDFSAVNVTCQGATAPLELLTNMFVLGAVITLVESDYQVGLAGDFGLTLYCNCTAVVLPLFPSFIPRFFLPLRHPSYRPLLLPPCFLPAPLFPCSPAPLLLPPLFPCRFSASSCSRT